MSERHRTPVQLRFADTDALGHVNNGSYVFYSEAARLQFFRDLGTEVRSLILACIAVDFRRQVTFGQHIDVESWVGRVGTTSVTLLQTIRADGEVAADIDSVIMRFDYATQRPTPWTSEERAALARHADTGLPRPQAPHGHP